MIESMRHWTTVELVTYFIVVGLLLVALILFCMAIYTGRNLPLRPRCRCDDDDDFFPPIIVP